MENRKYLFLPVSWNNQGKHRAFASIPTILISLALITLTGLFIPKPYSLWIILLIALFVVYAHKLHPIFDTINDEQSLLNADRLYILDIDNGKYLAEYQNKKGAKWCSDIKEAISFINDGNDQTSVLIGLIKEHKCVTVTKEQALRVANKEVEPAYITNNN